MALYTSVAAAQGTLRVRRYTPVYEFRISGLSSAQRRLRVTTENLYVFMDYNTAVSLATQLKALSTDTVKRAAEAVMRTEGIYDVVETVDDTSAAWESY